MKILSALLKNIIKSTKLYKRAGHHFRMGMIDRDEFLRGFIKSNGWLLSQPKSGTNLLCSTIAFYNAERLGIADYSFEDRYRLGLLHGARVSAQTIQDFNDFRLKSSAPVFVRTHDDVPGATPKFLINVTRNVLDNLVSAYHFSWEPRGFSVGDATRPMANHFVAIHKVQNAARDRAEQTVTLRYEHMKEDPTKAFTGLFDVVFGETDQSALAKALEAGSPERFKAWEKKAGTFVPEKTRDFQKSFIRSGKIGEGSDFFADKQIKEISSVLENAGLLDDPDVVL